MCSHMYKNWHVLHTPFLSFQQKSYKTINLDKIMRKKIIRNLLKIVISALESLLFQFKLGKTFYLQTCFKLYCYNFLKNSSIKISNNNVPSKNLKGFYNFEFIMFKKTIAHERTLLFYLRTHASKSPILIRMIF